MKELLQSGLKQLHLPAKGREVDCLLLYLDEIKKWNRRFGLVHAEDDDVIQKATIPLLNKNLTHPKYHVIARPAEAERVAIENIANIAEKTDCEFYIVHLNTAEGLNIAKQCDNIFIETSPWSHIRTMLSIFCSSPVNS